MHGNGSGGPGKPGLGGVEMYRMSKTADNIEKSDEDWMAYKEFKDLWEIGTLAESSIVYQKIERSSLKICRVYQRPEEAMYVTSRCLSVLAEFPFKRGCSLDDCIQNIINNEIISFWNFESDVQTDLAEMEHETRDLRILQEVFRRINTESFMRERIASRREIEETIIETVLSDVAAPRSAPSMPDQSSEPQKESANRRLFYRFTRLFSKH